jgi:hypothetical protein
VEAGVIELKMKKIIVRIMKKTSQHLVLKHKRNNKNHQFNPKANKIDGEVKIALNQDLESLLMKELNHLNLFL